MCAYMRAHIHVCKHTHARMPLHVEARGQAIGLCKFQELTSGLVANTFPPRAILLALNNFKNQTF